MKVLITALVDAKDVPLLSTGLFRDLNKNGKTDMLMYSSTIESVKDLTGRDWMALALEHVKVISRGVERGGRCKET